MTDRIAADNRQRAVRQRNIYVFGTALVLVMITSAYMQYTLGVLGPAPIERFSLTRAQLGSLTTVLFFVGSAGSPFAGRLVDRFPVRRVLWVPYAAAITGFLALGNADGYGAAAASVAVAGVGMSFSNPITNKLIAIHGPAGYQGLLMGVKQSGVQLAAAVTGLVMPAAVITIGLTGASVGTAMFLGAALVVVMLIVPSNVRAPARTPRTVMASPRATDPEPAGPSSLVVWIALYSFLMGAGTSAIYAYLPLFAYEELALSATRAGLLATLIGMIGIASRVCWGIISERMRHPSLALTGLAATAVLAQGLILASSWVGAWVLWLAAVILGGSAVAWNVVAMFAVVKVLGTGAAGRNSGIVQLGFFSGFAFGPFGFGILTDTYQDYRFGWTAIIVSFLLSTLLAGRWAFLTQRGSIRDSSASR